MNQNSGKPHLVLDTGQQQQHSNFGQCLKDLFSSNENELIMINNNQQQPQQQSRYHRDENNNNHNPTLYYQQQYKRDDYPDYPPDNQLNYQQSTHQQFNANYNIDLPLNLNQSTDLINIPLETNNGNFYYSFNDDNYQSSLLQTQSQVLTISTDTNSGQEGDESDEIPDEILTIIDDLENLYPSKSRSDIVSPILTTTTTTILTVNENDKAKSIDHHHESATYAITDLPETVYNFDGHHDDDHSSSMVINCHHHHHLNPEDKNKQQTDKMGYILPAIKPMTLGSNGSTAGCSSGLSDLDLDPKNVTIFACTYPGCGKSYNNRRSLNIHIPSHTKQKPFLCERCARRFDQEHNFRKHMLLTHFMTVPSNPKSSRRSTERRKYICRFPGCNRFFYLFSNLKVHHETHSLESRQQ